MITLLLRLFRLLPFFLGGHRQLALENLALRQQLAVYKRTMTRPPLRRTARHRCGRAYRLPLAPEATVPAPAELANVSDQSCPRLGLDRFLHRAHRAAPRPLRPCRARPPSPARRLLQRDRASHRPLDRPAGRGRLPRRLRPVLSPPRPRPSLWRALSAPREGHEARRSPHGPAQPLAESLRGAPQRHHASRVLGPCRRPRRPAPATPA